MQFSPELDEETTNAIRMIDSVVMNEESQYEQFNSDRTIPTPQDRKIIPPSVAPRRRQTVAFEADRSLTEVSDGEAVEENFEKLGVWQSLNIHLFILLCLRCAYFVFYLLKKLYANYSKWCVMLFKIFCINWKYIYFHPNSIY